MRFFISIVIIIIIIVIGLATADVVLLLDVDTVVECDMINTQKSSPENGFLIEKFLNDNEQD
jgi:hypothetical protein